MENQFNRQSENQKLENQLNLALDATEQEREKSDNLNVGYLPEIRSWELIVRFQGDLSIYEEWMDIVYLYGNYAIITVSESLIDRISTLPEIEYIEKPKRLFFSIAPGKRASCLSTVTNAPRFLTGEGILIGIIDSGIDITLPEFRNTDGSTRILSLWDQTIPGAPPDGYQIGSVFSNDQLNEQLQSGTILTRDISGHGTAVAGICAGFSSNYQGIAAKSSLLIVKLKTPSKNSFPNTSELMQAIDYLVKQALSLRLPLVINLSFGNNYGSHTGTSLIETFINQISYSGRIVICAGSGNEAASGIHYGGRLQTQEEYIELSVGSYESTLNIQLWKNYADSFALTIRAPNGEQVQIPSQLGTWRYILGNTELLVYYGEPTPYNRFQEIYLDFLPRDDYIDSGIWLFTLTPLHIVEGSFQLWLPSVGTLSPSTAFLRSSPESTLTIPSTATNVITVGAYNSYTMAYADFSGRGNSVAESTYQTLSQKPDIVAPGVNIEVLQPGGGTTRLSGTSFSTPFVSGSSALLMEWGIVRGNDPFLYGQKMKEYFIRGAKQLPGYTVTPNSQTGWGALCVRDSLPR